MNNQRKIGRYVIFGFVCFVVSFVTTFGFRYFIDVGIPFAGPIGNPHIEYKQWNRISMTYWVIYQNQNGEIEEREKSLEIEKTLSEKLRTHFRPRSTKGWALGNPYPAKIVTSRRDWYFAFESPQKTLFSRVSDTDFGYVSILENAQFYEELKTICTDHEKKSEPKISRDNIRLCRYNDGSERLVPFVRLDEEAVH